MNIDLKKQLIDWADRYETETFIPDDPISFPHRWKEKQDIEISAFITAWFSFGSRKQIRGICEMTDKFFQTSGSPLLYIRSCDWQQYENNRTTLYRWLKWHDFYRICRLLHSLYSDYPDMETMVLETRNTASPKNGQSPMVLSLCSYFKGCSHFGSESSACKRINMFLRWMVRQGSPVDFGLWTHCDSRELIIPLDTHVGEIARQLGITQRKSNDLKMALEITEAMKQVFPDDPVKGDFALFGKGIE